MRQKIPNRKKRIIFLRRNFNKKRFKKKWRDPRGMHNKRRLNKQGHQKRPTIGFKNPVSVRGLNKDNMLLIVIKNIKDLKNLDKSKQVALIAKTVGTKKRIMILEEAKKLGIKIQNIKDSEDFIKKIKKEKEEKKKESKMREEEKNKSKEISLKKAEERKKEEPQENIEKSPEEIKEEKKEEQKEELDLIKKEKTSKQYNEMKQKQIKTPGRIKEKIPEGNQ
jgi:large subunit ribosomal protein L32e